MNWLVAMILVSVPGKAEERPSTAATVQLKMGHGERHSFSLSFSLESPTLSFAPGRVGAQYTLEVEAGRWGLPVGLEAQLAILGWPWWRSPTGRTGAAIRSAWTWLAALGWRSGPAPAAISYAFVTAPEVAADRRREPATRPGSAIIVGVGLAF